jgi:hypothetical protein
MTKRDLNKINKLVGRLEEQATRLDMQRAPRTLARMTDTVERLRAALDDAQTTDGV